MYTLRPYQEGAVSAAVRYLKGPHKNNGIVVLPTGSGKSLCVANIIKELGEPTLVFQPSKEILIGKGDQKFGDFRGGMRVVGF